MSVPSLPFEVLHPIFVDLFGAPLSTSLHQQRRLPRPTNSHQVASVKQSLRDLANVAVICRAWSHVATEILYRRVFLLDIRGLRCFSRTIQENPSLGSLVREIWVLQDRPVKSSWIRSTFGMGHNLDRQSMRREFADALRHCINLQKLAFTADVEGIKPIFIPWDADFINESSIGPRLRFLDVYSNHLTSPHFDVIPKDSHLLNLEELTLSSTCLNRGDDFPVFAKLHTLNLCGVGVALGSQKPNTLKITSPSFPVLHNLLLSYVSVRVEIDEVCKSQLHSLCCFGDMAVQTYRSWINRDTRAFGSLRELEIDYPMPSLPPSLEILTLYIKMSVNTLGNPPLLNPMVLIGLQQSLVPLIPTLPRFSKLCLRLSSFEDAWDSSQANRALDEISGLLRAYDASVQVQRWTDQHFGYVEYLH